MASKRTPVQADQMLTELDAWAQEMSEWFYNHVDGGRKKRAWDWIVNIHKRVGNTPGAPREIVDPPDKPKPYPPPHVGP